jgi:hypothetical protein
MAKRIVREPDWPQGLVRQVIQQDAFMYSGVRKILNGVTWEPRALPDITYEDIGYGSNKHKQLLRNYFNEAEISKAQEILEKRAKQTFTSVAVSMRNSEKDSRSQGHCMQTIVITKTKDRTIAEIQYRSNELIQKLGGDLVFLPFVFERLGIEPDKVRFRFANAYLSGVFFPTLCRFWDPIAFLDFLFEHDPKLFAGGTRFFLRSAYQEDQHFPYSPENLQHRFAWKHLNMDDIKDYLHEKHKEFGKPLPKQHHNKEDYVPRGKR